MAEHTHSATSHVSAETVWDFVRDMDQWAPFLLGYQAHEKRSDTESTWTLKGDVGALSRTVDFRVHITEWTEPERVRFTLEGVSEPMEGDGSFKIERLDPAASDAAATQLEAPAQGFFLRLWTRLVRRLLGRGKVERSAASAPATVRLTFRLRLTPSGPMAPMLDAMIKPLMVATAEDLAQRIVAHLEAG
jgi:carbon monoxide dehydrogenase subunit G